MLELPEVLALSAQMQKAITGKKISCVQPPSKQHKFCWYSMDPADYTAVLNGCKVVSAEGFGIFVEIGFNNGYKLSFNDGINVRLLPVSETPKAYQLLIAFDDGSALVFTVSMYGSILLHDGGLDNEYYRQSRQAVFPFSPKFAEYFHERLCICKPGMSVKAFLATEQRIPGLGNGVLQDILFAAHMHPKRKLGTLCHTDRDALLSCTLSVLQEMTEHGGRDTQKDLFGNPGGYRTRMSKNTLPSGCPACGGTIIKETYLGGSVYYCPACQPLIKEKK